MTMMIKKLDIGCGGQKRGDVGMDKTFYPGVDVVHDLENIPYPFESESVESVIAVHIMEHIKPWLTIDVFNELWRICVPGAVMQVIVPEAGTPPYWVDPTHCNGFIGETFKYFDPDYSVYGVYRPKPWKVLALNSLQQYVIDAWMQKGTE